MLTFGVLLFMSCMQCGEKSDEQNISLIGVLSLILCALDLRLHACHHSSPISGMVKNQAVSLVVQDTICLGGWV